MKHPVRWLAALLLVAALPVTASAEWLIARPNDKLESTSVNAGVNWTSHMMYAKGIGVAPPTAVSPEHGRTLAVTAGTVLARQELLAVARGVAIDSVTRVQNAMVANSVTEARVAGVIRGAQVVDTRDLGGGAVEVTVAIPATGEFADLLMPKAPAPRRPPGAVQVALPVPAVVTAPPQAPQPPPAAAAPTPDRPKPLAPAYSGLVVDARGLGIKPAMAPKIVSEGGQEIYGVSVVDRNWVIQQGMAGYSKDLGAAQANDRVATRPVTIKAVSAMGSNKTDVVVSNADAQLLLGSGQTLGFLEQARVMLVVD